ncbi:cullin-4A [Trichonephila clavipes]|uniref:Cullin-4A n=1 Tax=Trichonephila clavipes TaxID=2585209 RepID=A0A8X6SIV8_TRICX|nr:cullin-4A [Trichonephila clavipes]
MRQVGLVTLIALVEGLTCNSPSTQQVLSETRIRIRDSTMPATSSPPSPICYKFMRLCGMRLATLTAVLLGLGSNPEEDMDVCNCIVSSRHWGILNSRRTLSHLVNVVEGKEVVAPNHPLCVLPQNRGETELSLSVTCMVVKATVNDIRHLAL